MRAIRPKRSEMVKIIQETVQPVRRVDRLTFSCAAGRVCAENLYSRNILPNTPVSRLDGIGVRYCDFEQGMPDTSHWELGKEYVYCNTGIAIPDGYDTVIAIEEVTVEEEGLRIQTPPGLKGQMIHAPGYHMEKGERLIGQGEVITPAHVGLLAAGGVRQVPVYAKPTVAVIPTGDELVAPTDQLPLGKNIDTNSYMIGAYLAQFGAEPDVLPVVEDNPEQLRAAFKQALASHDAVIVIAGSSLGTKDYTIPILRELGDVLVPELAHGPGRKSSLSVVEGKSVLGIAGPPMGAQIVCDLYLAPFVSALRGQPFVALQKLEVICDDSFPPRRADFCERVHIYRGEDGYHIRSTFAPKTTRAQMETLSNGNFYRLAGTSCEKGSTTTVELLRPIEYISSTDQLHAVLGEEITPYE